MHTHTVSERINPHEDQLTFYTYYIIQHVNVNMNSRIHIPHLFSKYVCHSCCVTPVSPAIITIVIMAFQDGKYVAVSVAIKKKLLKFLLTWITCQK